ncbi:MAG: hypothetical protein HPY52_15010 [Firmicutes bacterium]|nr:hypothetical protein [Bacillota bacterium]
MDRVKSSNEHQVQILASYGPGSGFVAEGYGLRFELVSVRRKISIARWCGN